MGTAAAPVVAEKGAAKRPNEAGGAAAVGAMCTLAGIPGWGIAVGGVAECTLERAEWKAEAELVVLPEGAATGPRELAVFPEGAATGP